MNTNSMNFDNFFLYNSYIDNELILHPSKKRKTEINQNLEINQANDLIAQVKNYFTFRSEVFNHNKRNIENKLNFSPSTNTPSQILSERIKTLYTSNVHHTPTSKSIFNKNKVNRVLIILSSNLIKECEEYKIIEIEEEKLNTEIMKSKIDLKTKLNKKLEKLNDIEEIEKAKAKEKIEEKKIAQLIEKKYEKSNYQIDTCYLQSELNILKTNKYDYIITLNSSISNILSYDKIKYKVTESKKYVKEGRILKIFISKLLKNNYKRNQKAQNSIDFKYITGQTTNANDSYNNNKEKELTDFSNTLLSIFCGIDFSENNELIKEKIENHFFLQSEAF